MKHKIILTAVILTAIGAGYAGGRLHARSGRTTSETTEARTETDQSTTTTTTTQVSPTVVRTVVVTDGKKTLEERHTEDTKIRPPSLPPAASKRANRMNVSVLAGIDFSSAVPKPTYGVSINKEFIGPITVGVFGLTNGTIGASIGVNF